jgi:predicted protein tyrosine phosphatase
MIFAMESAHKCKLNQKYAHLLKGRRVILLGIPDRYECMTSNEGSSDEPGINYGEL